MILKVATLRSLRCLSRFGAGGHGRGVIQVKVESWRKLVKVSAFIKGLRCADRRPSPDSPQPINVNKRPRHIAIDYRVSNLTGGLAHAYRRVRLVFASGRCKARHDSSDTKLLPHACVTFDFATHAVLTPRLAQGRDTKSPPSCVTLGVSTSPLTPRLAPGRDVMLLLPSACHPFPPFAPLLACDTMSSPPS
jgi:hypothetical protein